MCPTPEKSLEYAKEQLTDLWRYYDSLAMDREAARKATRKHIEYWSQCVHYWECDLKGCNQPVGYFKDSESSKKD
jgi:hypothetical protein